jgi:hypothetical protein
MIKKIVIIVIIAVVSYMYVGSDIVNNGVNVVKERNIQLEEIMNY